MTGEEDSVKKLKENIGRKIETEMIDNMSNQELRKRGKIMGNKYETEATGNVNLKNIKIGYNVNFERSMTFGTELGGHIVSGHIHATAKVADITYAQKNCQMSLILDPHWMKYILHKGFVSINGCSLTVG